MGTSVVHISLTETRPGAVELRYWRDNPNEFAPRSLATDEIADLVKQAELDYYGAGGATREAEAKAKAGQKDLVVATILDAGPGQIGTRLFRWLDGSDRWLARQFKTLGAGPVVLAVEAAGSLGHLPWELLHDGTTFLVHGASPAVLPVRWRPTAAQPQAPRNRPLNVLFMATSPVGVEPELDFEAEEGRILKATETYPLSLTVEETGNLDELGVLASGYPEGYFDVLHLTGHADHRPEGPRFLTESATGEPRWVSGEQIARALPPGRRPGLVFLSGCRTGQSSAEGSVPSLAEELLAHGFAAVIGWGRPVYDADAIVAAAALYERLAAGFSPVEALLHAHDRMREAKARHWHLLRLFVAGEVPGPTVTAPNTPGRPRLKPITHNKRFLGRSLNAGGTVVDRADFVGRRRPLQRFLRALKDPKWPAGAVIHGLGGVGKSSLACRLCDRLEGTHDAVVHFGILDEPGFLRSLRSLAGITAEQLRALQAAADPLDFRLRDFLNLRAAAGLKPVLFVLDDFERNTPVQDGRPLIEPAAQEVLEALAWAIEESAAGRCLVTSRYRLATSQAARFYQEELSALRGAEAAKKYRGLPAFRAADPGLRERAARVADGNPRLMERLDLVLKERSLAVPALLARLEAVEAQFREEVLERSLVAGLPEEVRRLLAALLVYELPVPFAAVTALFPDQAEAELEAGLKSASALGLVEHEPQPAGPVYRVPRLLEPILEPDRPADPGPITDAAASALFHLWWDGGHPATEPESLEILRLGHLARRAEVVVPVASSLGPRWEQERRYREACVLYEASIAAAGRDYRLLGGLGRVEVMLGDGERADSLLEEALRICPADDEREHSRLLFDFSGRLIQRGEADKALPMVRDELLPLLERLGDAPNRAVAMGKIADVLQSRGEHDEALRIRREEELPVYERLGDVRERAVTMGKIADVLQSRGENDEALRIHREECLPVFERLGDVRERAVVLVKVADSR